METEATAEEPKSQSPGTWRYISTKISGALVSLLFVILLGFFAFRILPGDPAISMTRGRAVAPGEVERIRQELGLDQPLLVQFGRYIRDLFTGRLGTSYTYNQPVSELIAERVGATLLLTGTAFLIAVTIGLWLGQRAAWKRGTGFDTLATSGALVFWSVPTFWLGLLLLLLFGGPLPTSGMKTAGEDLTGFALAMDIGRHMVLPVTTIVLVTFAQYLLTMRSSMLEEMTADYLVTARAKGLNEDRVRTRHALPNAMLPTVTLVFMHLGTLIGGAVTTEAVFSWPGLGYLTYSALALPDLPLLQGSFVVFSSIVIVMNLIADLLYRVLDPRLKAA